MICAERRYVDGMLGITIQGDTLTSHNVGGLETLEANPLNCFCCTSKQVSWVRRKGEDLHLITFGQHTYSSDSRYILEYQAPNDWQLLIQYANERDEGHYECQVSSHPPLVYIVYLTVVGKYLSASMKCLFALPLASHVRYFSIFLVFYFFSPWPVPRVEIVDERGLSTPDKYYKAGSTIELKCIISKVPQPTSYVTWKHGVRMLNYDTSRGGIR